MSRPSLRRSHPGSRRPSRPPRVKPGIPLLLTVLLAVFATVLGTWGSQLFRSSAAIPITRPTPFDAAGPSQPSPELPRFDVERIPVEHRLERGQTLGDVLADLGLERREAHEAVTALSQHLDVRRLRAGEPYVAYYPLDPGDSLEPQTQPPAVRPAALEWPLGNEGRVLAERVDGHWRSSFVPFQRRVEVRSMAGTLEGSLIGSIERAGASAMLAYKMAWVLQWDLDFNRDLRRGDRFEVLYEQVYLDGLSAGLGDILALRYENGGPNRRRTLEAFRFQDEDSYYDSEGRPLKKMFLRSPLEFSRVTSRFSHRRFHPVLKRYRPHYGVDYGAPVGTPVRVTANGSVTFAGRSGGAGRMVKVRHPNNYLTAYLHLSRFAQGIRSGRRVKQGEVIGYVGSTGLSTGPHLDYRVQHRGRWIDPLSLKSIPAEPIAEAQMAEFRIWRDALQARLERGVPLPDGLLAPEPRNRPQVVDSPVAGAATAR